jgi:hypothetical protein
MEVEDISGWMEPGGEVLEFECVVKDLSDDYVAVLAE